MDRLILFLLFACQIQNVIAGCKSSTSGKEFVFGILNFGDNGLHNSNNILTLGITNVSPNDAYIRLQIPVLNKDTHFNIPHGEGKTVKIDPKIQKYGTFVGSRGIRITSNNDISVIFTNTYDTDNTIDSCNIIPVTNIERNYTISSYSGIYGSVLLVAGVTNDTNVTIFNGTDVLYSARINLFDVLQYTSCVTSCDVTGIRVIADKPVSVSSGSTYAALLTNSGGKGDYIVSEMLPLKAWSRKYIVSPVLPKTAFVSRMLVENAFSRITVSNISKSYKFTPSSTNQYFETEALVLTSDNPFSVTQYGVRYDSDDNSGNPFMTVVPGVDQYINNYIFTVPHGHYGNLKHYVSLIVPKMYKDGFVLDGKSLHVYNQTNQAKILDVPAPFDNYTILTFRVNEGYHHFYHSSEKVTFGVFVYGHGYFLSYGFFAGYDLNGDCRIQTSTSTTTSISTSTMTSSTTSSTSLLQPRGQMCYNCEDLSHVDLCDTVKQCSKQEVCFTERYEDSGQTKFKTGCLLQNTCEMKHNDSRYSDALCFGCCHGDYCNNKGCGESGIPDRDRRGPICFDCQHVSSPEECVKISPCDSNQVCRIEEYKWFDHSHFKLGCGHGLCDPASRMGSHVFKRSTPVCQLCCTEDYCNRNCTTTSQGQTGSVIVG